MLRDWLYDAMDFAVTFLIYLLLMIPVHEAAHYWIGSMLGYSMVAHFPSPFGGYVVWNPVPVSHAHIIAIGLAGGCFVAAFYFLISVFTEDWETDLVVGYFGIGSLIYAGFEVAYLFHIVPLSVLGTAPWLLALVPLLLMLYGSGSISLGGGREQGS